MNHTVVDVLIYIFEHYAYHDAEVLDDHARLSGQLMEVGFESRLVRSALDWLENLAEAPPLEGVTMHEPGASHRCYTVEEQHRLDTACRGFLLFLEGSGVLDAVSRERVIDRVMALEVPSIDVEQLKWLVLMVLFNLPGYQSPYYSVEDLIHESECGFVH